MSVGSGTVCPSMARSNSLEQVKLGGTRDPRFQCRMVHGFAGQSRHVVFRKLVLYALRLDRECHNPLAFCATKQVPIAILHRDREALPTSEHVRDVRQAVPSSCRASPQCGQMLVQRAGRSRRGSPACLPMVGFVAGPISGMPQHQDLKAPYVGSLLREMRDKVTARGRIRLHSTPMASERLDMQSASSNMAVKYELVGEPAV